MKVCSTWIKKGSLVVVVPRTKLPPMKVTQREWKLNLATSRDIDRDRQGTDRQTMECNLVRASPKLKLRLCLFLFGYHWVQSQVGEGIEYVVTKERKKPNQTESKVMEASSLLSDRGAKELLSADGCGLNSVSCVDPAKKSWRNEFAREIYFCTKRVFGKF